MRGTNDVTRYLRFGAVGLLGLAVQLGVFTVVHGLGAHHLAASALGVEAALLHNFVLHERWTWRDRARGGRRARLLRLWRFHAINGSISFGGNMAIMAVLTGSFGAPPLLATVAAVALCSAANFAAGGLLVFTRAGAPVAFVLALAASASAGHPDASVTAGAELQAHTVKAWNAYEQQVDRRYEAASAAAEPFFALDAFGVQGWREAARRGEIVMREIDTAAPGAAQVDIRDGRIHHWVGAVFIPAASLEAVLARLAVLAGSEADHYDDVTASRLLAREGDRYRVFMRLRRTNIVTVTYNTEHVVVYSRHSPGRASARSEATRIAEVADAGTPRERERPPGSDSGYLWRLNAYWRYQQTTGGVLIECESVSLSRSIPLLLRPFITGIVEGVARESLERTLAGLRRVLTRAS